MQSPEVLSHTPTRPEPSSAVGPVRTRAGPAPQRELLVLAALFAAFALVRAVLFPWAENLYGDAVVRAELAEHWVQSPHLIRSFYDGTYQFGPLHLYWMGAFLKLWASRQDATRLASLVAAVLMVFPVYRIGRRLFGRRAAAVTVLCLAAWSLHLQASTTAASEALFLTLFFFSLDFLTAGIVERRTAPLVLAAAFANLYCATRYDGWMYAPLFALAVALGGRPNERRANWMRAALFLALCAPWPLWWSYQSWRATGDPLFAIHYIDDFHRRWVHDGMDWLGPLRFRLMALFFWPGTLLVTGSALVGLFAIAGMVRAFVRRERRLLALLAVVPAAYFTARAAILVDFSPLARFTMVQVALALFYVEDGFDWICGAWSRRARGAALAATAALAVATPLWLGWFTAWKQGALHETLRPITPLSTIPVAQHDAAAYLRTHVADGEAVVFDAGDGYADLNVAFFSGLPEDRMIRRRWEDFESHLGWSARPVWVVALDRGALAREGFAVGESDAEWRGHRYRVAKALGDGVFVYHRE